MVFKVKVVIQVYILPLFLGVEKRRDLFPLLINLRQTLKVFLDPATNLGQVYVWLGEYLPNIGIFFAVVAYFFDGLIKAKVSIQYLHHLYSPSEYSFVKVGRFLFKNHS